jgi:putative methyltransferase (TIGR04325 family)
MGAKQLVKKLAPRVWSALGALHRKSAHRGPNKHREPDEWRVTFEGRYATWGEVAALTGADAFPVASKDYRASLRTSTDDWDGYFKHYEVGLLAAVMSAMASTRSPQKTVVDFGGGYGVHFLTLLKANLIPCQWEVVELKDVAQLGTQKWRHNRNIQFIETLESATHRPDLVVASGVFQYLADPYASVRQIEALEPSFMFVDRLPMINEDRDVYTVQRIGVAYFGVERAVPHVLFSHKRLVAELTRDFDLVFRFQGFQDPSHGDSLDDGSTSGAPGAGGPTLSQFTTEIRTRG